LAQVICVDCHVIDPVSPMEPLAAAQPTCIARLPLQRRTAALEEAKKVERQRMLDEWKKERYTRQPQRGAGGARSNLRRKENRTANGNSAAISGKLCPRGRQAADGNPCLLTPKHRAHLNAVFPLAEIFQNNADTGSTSHRDNEKLVPTTPRPIIDEAAKELARATAEEVMRITSLDELVPCPPGTPSSPSVRVYKSFNPFTMNECYQLPPDLMVKLLTELLEGHAEPEPPESVPQQEEQVHEDHNCGMTPERLLERLDQAVEEEAKKEEEEEQEEEVYTQEVSADAQLCGDLYVYEDPQPCEDSQFCEQLQFCDEDPQFDEEQHEFRDEDTGERSQDLHEDLPQRLRRHVIQWGEPVPLTEEDLLSRAHDIYTFWFFETRERIANKLTEFDENPTSPLACIAEYPPDWPQWRIDSFDLREAARAARSSSLTPKSRRTPPTPVLLGAFGEVEFTEDGIN